MKKQDVKLNQLVKITNPAYERYVGQEGRIVAIGMVSYHVAIPSVGTHEFLSNDFERSSFDLTESTNADWSFIWSKEQAEAELNDFKFSGIGWYKHGTGMLLVQESNYIVQLGVNQPIRRTEGGDKNDSPAYRFTVFSMDARTLMSQLSNLPIHSEK